MQSMMIRRFLWGLPLLAIVGCGSGGPEDGSASAVNQPLVIQPGVAASMKQIDASKIEAQLVADYWQGHDQQGNPLYRVDYRIKNNSGRPLAAYTMQIDFSVDGTSFTKTTNHSPQQGWGDSARSIMSLLLPGMRSTFISTTFPVDPRYYLRDDVTIKLTPKDCKEMVILEDHPQNWDQLAWLIFEGDMEKLRGLFDQKKELLDVRTTTGHGPLQLALFSGNVELAKYLQSKGADIKAVGANNDNALNWAAYGGGKAVEYVRSQGIRPSVSFESRFTPYFDAILAGKPDAIAELKKANAPINAQTEEGYTPLSYAIRYNDIEAAEALIAAGASKDFIHQGRYNMIGLAATAMRAPNFARIAKHAESVNQAGPDGSTPLHLAVENHATGTVRWLLLNGGNPKLKNKAGLTAKDIADTYGHQDLLSAFANPKKP